MRPRTPLAVSIFLVLVIAGLVYSAIQNQSQIGVFQDLTRNGQTMQARVIALEQYHRRYGLVSFARYDFQIGDNAYQGSSRIDGNEFHALKVGGRIPVSYSPDNPSISTFNPSGQEKTERLQQIACIAGALLGIVWLVFAIRGGIANGWTTSDV